MPRIHTCTWAKSVDSPELSLLQASASRLGIEPKVLPCRGFLDKPVVLEAFVSSLPEDDLLLFTDGYDVLYVQPEDVIRSRFFAFDAPLVFSGEDGCYHHLAEAKRYFEQAAPGEPYPYLNSGLAMGTVGAVREMLREILAWGEEARREFDDSPDRRGFFNDQTLFGRYACRHPSRVRVDARAELFWTLASEKYDVAKHAAIRPGELENLECGTRPCAVHVSHRRKFYLALLHIAHQLGLPLTRREVDLDLAGRLLDAESKSAEAERIVIAREVRQHLEGLRGCDRVAILFVGTGRYFDYFADFYTSSRRLLFPGTPKVYWVFTDQGERPELRRDDVVWVDTQPEKWPYSTLLRFRYFNRVRDALLEYSHIVYLDADMVVHAEITEGELLAPDRPLFGVQHPGNTLKGQAPYETRPESRASVDPGTDTSMYWQGCLWGGRARDVLDLSWVLARRVDDDLARDVIAKWHDESHLNKYFAEQSARVHTLHSGYAYPETLEGKLPLEKKIVHLAKRHAHMRSPVESGAAEASTEPAAPLSKFWVPVRRQGCRLEKAADSFALLDAEEREIARINETAAQIWRLCDGRVSVGELIRILSAIHFAAPRAVREDVHQVLRALEGHGLMSFEKKPPRHAEPGPNAIRFYSFANRVGSPQLRLLKESAEHEGVSVEVLGDGLARFPTTVKLDLLYEQVRELDDDQIVCAVDGFDVFFCAGAEEIARKFRAMGCDCVFSAERAYSHQYPKYRKFYDELPVDSPYRYLNAGSIIGYAHALKKICAPTLSTRLQPLVINPRSINRIKRWSSRVAKTLRLERFDPGFIYSYVYYTDQQHYGKVVARGSSKLRIRLDHDTELFWCTAFEWRDIEAHYRTESGRIVNVHTGNVPAVIHVPGWRVHGHVFRRLAEVHSSLAGDR